MTHPSPTALEEISGALDALRTNQRQLDQDGVFVGVSRQALDEVLTHIAALEAEIACERDDKSRLTDEVIGGAIPENDPKILAELAALPVERLCERLRGVYALWPGAEPRRFYTGAIMHEAARRIEEAQLATRLPTEAQISYLLEVLAKEGMTNGGGDFMRRKISKAILALLSGAATPLDPEKMPEEIALLKEQVNEIEARVKPTIGPTFGSDGNGGIRETREGRIQSTDFYTLLGLATAGVLKHEAALKAADRVTGEAAPFTDAELDDVKISGFIPPRAFATIQALRKSGAATPAPTAALTWRPIETAPRDRRPFLTWDPHYGIRIGVCHVRPDHDDWLSYKDNFGGSSKGGMRATHWMPLPSPPSPDAKDSAPQGAKE